MLEKEKYSQKTLWFLKERDSFETSTEEEEFDIEEDQDQCIVHKGPIRGLIYSCPGCGSKYCLRCAKTIKEKEENCWVCNAEIKFEE